MKGIASKILIALGIIFILAAILWWAIAVNALVKIPDDVDSTTYYQGEMTWYVNPITQEPLPEGSEMKGKMEVERSVLADSKQYSSSIALLTEEVKTSIKDLPGIPALPDQTYKFAYVLDRKNSENVKDDRAFAWKTENVVDREGTYYPLLPFDTSKDRTYKVWKNEINEAAESEFVNEEEKEGVTVYNFKGSFENKEVTPTYIEVLGLPQQMTFADIKPVLVAMGVDVDNLIALATQRLSPEDLQALNQALQAAIPVTYLWSMETEISVEPKTGSPVDAYKDHETLSMKVDLTKMMGVFAVLTKYAQDPVLGPALGKLADLQTLVGEMGAQKVFEYSYEQTDDSVKQSMSDAKDSAGKINLVKVYIPWALLIVGALILIIGLLIGGGGAVPQAEE
jgi:hypothetical protein